MPAAGRNSIVESLKARRGGGYFERLVTFNYALLLSTPIIASRQNYHVRIGKATPCERLHAY